MRLQHLFLFLILAGDLCAQSDNSYIQPLKVDGNNFNLSSNVVFQDRIGYLWIGTNNGLYRYDGQKLTTFQYNVFKENSLPNNTITSISEDKIGNLWIGTESYLVFYERSTNKFHGYYKNETSKILGVTIENRVYANLFKTGIINIAPTSKTDSLRFSVVNGSLKPQLVKDINFSMAEDVYGRTWLATPGGLMIIGKEGTPKPIDFPEKIILLKPHKENTLLAVTRSTVYHLAYRKEDAQLELLKELNINMPNEFEPVDIAAIPKTSSFYLLSRSDLYKLNLCENEINLQPILNQNKEDNLQNTFNSLCLDAQENLWIASSTGVVKMAKTNDFFSTINIPKSNSRIEELYVDNGVILAGNTAGEIFHVPESNTELPRKILQEDGQISVLKKGYHETMWLGVDHQLKSIRKFKLNQKNSAVQEKNYPSRIEDILPLNSNETWIGLWANGIDIINNSLKISDFKQSLIQQLNGLNISVLTLDSKNRVWIGTRGEGIYVADLTKEQVTHYYPKDPTGISSNAILSLLEHHGKMYIGTRGGGLNVFDLATEGFSVYNQETGLNSLTIAAMEADKKGNIWLATIQGISVFDRQLKTFTNFSQQYGLKDNQFLFNVKAKKSNGVLFFTNGQRITKIKTSKYKKRNEVAKTLITSFEVLATSKDEAKLFNLIPPYHLNQPLKLPHTQNNVTFNFTSLDFTAPDKNRFSYKMEGVNDYWVYSNSSKGVANYNSLQPGDYTFKVKSTNSHGVWNQEPAVVQFSIKPAIWLSSAAIWMYTILGLLGLAFALKLYQNWYQMKKDLVAETVSHQKDQELHQMKMVFFTDISHELRTPLTLIQGTIEKTIRDGQYRLQENTAKRIYNNSKRIGRLIDQIMDIRKNEVGMSELKIAKGDLVNDVLNLKKAFEDFAQIHSITYSFSTDYENITGYYDFQILEKVLFNLLSNAFKYTSEHGSVAIHLTTTQINLDKTEELGLKPGKYMNCTVKDNGLGISKANLPYIFDRYYQSTKMPAHQIPGTGIGMELVQKLVRSHGGTINVDSEENKFTHFTFLLPIEKAHYTEQQLLQKQEKRKPSITTKSEYQVMDEVTASGLHTQQPIFDEQPKILLVDDNEELRTMMREELFKDFEIIEAENGQIGYQKALEEAPNLIISDILMPVADGISMLKRIKQENELEHIPVFMLTAKDSEETKIKCLSLGATDYIEKPFSPEFLKWKIKNMLFSRKSLKEKYSKVISVKTSELELTSNDEKLIKKLVTIVENTLTDSTLSVEYLAQEVGMSRANLYRKLQAILDETPVNFIKKIRLNRACQLLKKNNMYVSEVAYMAGFSNPKYFAKCFNKEFGMSPKEYCKKHETQTELEKKKNLDAYMADNV